MTNSYAPAPLSRLWHSITRPPYAGVPWLVFLYAIVSCLVYTDNGPFTGHIVGFDDQVRLVQALQWVNGGGWYDRLITRTNSPEGFQTIWARIVDIPIAVVVLFAQIFVTQHTAALVASVILPLFELWLMFVVSRYFARPLAGKKEANLVVLFVMFTTVLNHQYYTLAGFHPGEMSHHAWYGILNVLMFGAAARVVLGVAGWKPQAMLGLAIALSLAVGIEGFPMIAGTVAVFSALSWWFRNERLAWRGTQGLSMGAVLSLLLLPIHVPPSHFFEVSFSQPSIMGPLMMGVAAAYLFLQNKLLQQKPHRLTSGCLLVLLAGVMAWLLVQFFPEILKGATAGLSEQEQKLAAAEHPEVWTMFHVAPDWVQYVSLLVPPALAIGFGFTAMASERNTRRRMMYGAYAGFALVPTALAQVYWRYIHHLQTSICPLLLRLWQKIRARIPRSVHASLLSFGVFVMLVPFWMILAPALDMDAPFMTQVAFFPAKIYTQPYSCDALSITDYLNKHYPPETNIVVPDWDSSVFLYETDLHVDFLSNYPSHDHFLDNRRFFQAQDMELSRRVAANHHFNLVAMCSFIPMAADIAASRPHRLPSMIERLREGSQPAWLKPVNTGIRTNYLLFAIDPVALAAAAQPLQGQ